MLELGYQFDIVDTDADFSSYAALILPDGSTLSPALQAIVKRLSGFRRQIDPQRHCAAFDPASQTFQLDDIPVRYAGTIRRTELRATRRQPDRLSGSDDELADDYDYVFYGQSHVVRPRPGAKTYGDLRPALFNRTWEHYMGHQHAPAGQSLDAR